MNTHLRNHNTEVLEDKPLELGGSPCYLDEETDSQGEVYVRLFLRMVS